jgi:hypothetical protein
MANRRPNPNPKITGKIIGEFKGFTIYGKLNKAKAQGKDRIWIQIRQTEPKKYRVHTCLSYARSMDIQFVDD